MKLRFFTALVTAFCVCLISSFVCAADGYLPEKVVDSAGLLSASEEDSLRREIAEVIERYQCDIAVITVLSTEGKTPRAFADDYFDENGYGIGTEQDGILLLISMKERDWYLSTHGSAIRTFTDYGLDYIGDQITDRLSSGDYAEAFSKFVSLCGRFLKQAEKGTPYDVGNQPKSLQNYLFYLAISVAAGVIVAFAVTSSMKSKLKTAVPRYSANHYVKEGGVRLTSSRDLYLYRTVSRVARPRDTGGSSRGGSSTHRSSSGRTHGGRGGKF